MPFKPVIYIFADLDDSLFQTRRKCPAQAALSPAAVDRQGQPLSYFTQQQQTLAAWLGQGVVIPVTGRNSAALERVRLPFTGYRITSHGALILDPAGRPDEEWLQLQRSPYEQWLERMRSALAWAEQTIAERNLALRCRIIEDQGFAVYISIKGEEAMIGRLAQAARRVWAGQGSQVHYNGQNLALLPPFARKEQAVEFLMQRFGMDGAGPLFIGLGDSLGDLPFLRLCHYAVTPRGSQIQAMTWDRGPAPAGSAVDGR